MTSDDIRNCILSNGLRKALIEAGNELLDTARIKIELETHDAPEHQSEWRRGSFSWVWVRGVEYWSNWFYREMEYITMAGKQRKAPGRKSLDQYSFVRCELNAEDKKSAKMWIDKNLKDLPAIMHDVLADGYKLSCSFSSDHDTFTASLTGKDGALNEYKTLTARHKDWVQATMTVLYKNAVMFKSGVWETDEMEDDGWA